jgi:hypothetical protein
MRGHRGIQSALSAKILDPTLEHAREIGSSAAQRHKFRMLISRGRTKRFVSLFQVGREHIFDPFHECADSTREVPPMRYYKGHGKRPATKVGENFHQRSTLQISANPKKRGLNHAKTGEGSGFVGLCAVDVQRT